MRQLRRILSAVALTIAVTTFAEGQDGREQATPGDAVQELVTLSREATKDLIGKEMCVVEGAGEYDLFGKPRGVTCKGEWDEINLNDANVRIDGGEAFVSGSVVFKSGDRGRRASEISTPVVFRFLGREGRWHLAGMCMGKCSAE